MDDAKLKLQKRTELVGQLLKLEDEAMIEVFRELFELRTPYPEEQKYHRNHYFLGVASSSSMEGEPQPVAGEWNQWGLIAIAYLDPEEFPNGVRVTDFYQFARCSYCNTSVACTMKTGLCPICGVSCSLT